MLTQLELMQEVSYNPETGLFIWLRRSNRKLKVGDIAGTLAPNGYIVITIIGKKYGAHRLAWLYMTGKFPKDSVDHQNMIRSDNRWSNLREATKQENLLNRNTQRNNKLKVKGVYKSAGSSINPFVARIRMDGIKKHIGVYATVKEASIAYAEKAIELFGEFYRETNEVISETSNYILITHVVDDNYQIINIDTGIVEKVGLCLPLMLYDLRLLQTSLDKELLTKEDLINLDQLYEI